MTLRAPGVVLVGVALASRRGGATRRSAQRAGARRVDFNSQIRPLLSDRCFRCHGPDAAKRKAKLRLDTRDGALKDIGDGWAIVKPGDPDRSELIRRTHTDYEDDVMPPLASHLTLSAAEKALLRRWVVEGADYQPHWSLIPVHAVAVPKGADPTPANPIDAFVRERLRKERTETALPPAPQARPETLLRRLAFNLTGLPPTPAEIDAFLADRSRRTPTRASSTATSPRRPTASAWRWTGSISRATPTPTAIRPTSSATCRRTATGSFSAFNQNLPYDQFLLWQLAGDLLPDATREQRIATAFNRLHRQTNEGGSIEEEFRTEYVVDRVNTFGTAMLGLTLECARCHDHKFDPITQRDYYSLFAFFNSIDESGLYSHFTNATPSPSLLLWPAAAEKAHDLLNARIAATEARLAAISSAARRAFRALGRDRVDGLEAGRSGQPARADRAPRVQRPSTATRRRTRVLKSVAQVQEGLLLVRGVPGPGWSERRARVQRRQPGRPSRRPAVRPHRSLLLQPSPPADRDAGPRRDPASVARLVGCRQPRLRADAGSRTPVLRARALLAGQCHRRSRQTSACQ